MRIGRWSWLIAIPLALVVGILITRFVFLERSLRNEMGDEMGAPLSIAKMQIEAWNQVRSVTHDQTPITDSTFSTLDDYRRISHSRTTLLERKGDSIVVLATGSKDTVALTKRSIPFSAASREIQTAFTSRGETHGAGVGFAYERAFYQTAHIKGTNWVLLREVDGVEVVADILIAVTIDAAFVASLLLFAFGYLRSKRRVIALQREQELSEVRGDFLAAVSHELRTPLAQIRMFAELMRNGSMRKPEETSRALGVIEKESSRLSILVDNVLNHARLRGGHTAQAADAGHATDVDRDIQYVMDAFAPLAREKNVQLVREGEESLYAAIDSAALRQILLNFLENAVKYGPAGQTVTLGSGRSGNAVRIWVQDQGPGVPAGERTTIWKAFERGDAAVRTKAGGSGIGLSVVQQLVTEHGGKVWVDDSPAGARFVLELKPAVDH